MTDACGDQVEAKRQLQEQQELCHRQQQQFGTRLAQLSSAANSAAGTSASGGFSVPAFTAAGCAQSSTSPLLHYSWRVPVRLGVIHGMLPGWQQAISVVAPVYMHVLNIIVCIW